MNVERQNGFQRCIEIFLKLSVPWIKLSIMWPYLLKMQFVLYLDFLVLSLGGG